MSQPVTYPLTEETVNEIQKLAALGYTLKEMAMYFDYDYFQFKTEANNPDSELAYNIARGKLIVKANADMKLFESAENGNVTAIQQLAKILKDKRYKDLLHSLNDD